MAALSITAASVAYVSGPVQQDAVAGEAFVAGAMLYFNTSDQRWYKAKCASYKVTFAAMGRGSSQVQLGYLYDAGSVAP